MNILWVPHTPWNGSAVSRDRHLIRHLKKRGHNVATVQWPVKEKHLGGGAKAILHGLFRRQSVVQDTQAYQVRRLPDPTRSLRNSPMSGSVVNEFLFSRDIRWAVDNFQAEVLVTAFSSYMTGYPPFDLNIPVVFDYVDLVNWENHPYKPDLRYIENADAVICVSKAIEERAIEFSSATHYIPNGADVVGLRRANGETVRRKYGLDDHIVVSLIGLNVGSSGLYFLDGILRAHQRDPSIRCLLVGESEVIRDYIDDVDPERDVFIYVGRVPYSKVFSYYAASDIGLYPAIGGTYDDGRSPIKVFEYSACGIPVVSTPIREVKSLGFENIIFTDPQKEAFSKSLLKAKSYERRRIENIERYDWSNLSQEVELLLFNLVK